MTKRHTAEIYLIRHAESLMNTNPHLIGGRSNETPLTAKGIEQAKALGLYLLSRSILPTAVYVSPAKRTQETADYSLAEMGLTITPIIDDALQELGQGDAEGLPRIDVYTPEVLEQILLQGKDFKLRNGESMNDVGDRMHDWVERTVSSLEEHDSPHKIAVYTHGGAITYLASKLQDWPHQKTYEFQKTVTNTSVSKFVFKNGELTVDYLKQDPK